MDMKLKCYCINSSLRQNSPVANTSAILTTSLDFNVGTNQSLDLSQYYDLYIVIEKHLTKWLS